MIRRAWFATPILFACATLAGCHKEEAHASEAPPAIDAGAKEAAGLVRVDRALVDQGRITTAAVTRRPLKGDVRVPAETVASENGAAEVGALVGGRVATIDVHDGDAVKRGQVIATIDSPEAARVGADAIRARARLVAATRKHDRQKALETDRATSGLAIDEAFAELETARADVAASRSLLASLGIPEPANADGSLLLRVPLRSPIDGVLVERLTSLGAPVGPEKTLFRVVSNDRVVVEARWTDPTAPAPGVGTKVDLFPRGAATNRAACKGAVIATLAVVDDRTRAKRVRIAPEAPCPIVTPGSFVDAAFTSSEGDAGAPESAALVVPRSAIIDVRGAPTAFVTAGQPGTFVARVLRLGRVTNEDATIEDGVSEGDRIATSGAVLLKGELMRAELE